MDDEVLASDAEREAAVAALRAHVADGRLTTDEFAARVEEVYAARTRGELAAALRQLPERAPAPTPRPRLIVLAAKQTGYSLIVFVACTLVWAFTGMHGDFWPKWVLLAVLIGLVTRVGKAAFGDEEARAELEKRFGGGPPAPPGLPKP